MISRVSMQNKNRPSFKSRIVVSSELYDKQPLRRLFEQGKRSGRPWSIKQAILADEGYSDRADVCSIALLKPKDGNIGFLTHIIPIDMCDDIVSRLFHINGFNPVKKRIKQIAKQLTKPSENSSGKLSGILVGGKAEGSKDSIALCDKFTKLYQDLNVDFTSILRRRGKNLYVNMYFSAKDDLAIIKIFGPKPVKNMSDLRETFDIVHISPNDTIEFS